MVLVAGCTSSVPKSESHGPATDPIVGVWKLTEKGVVYFQEFNPDSTFRSWTSEDTHPLTAKWVHEQDGTYTILYYTIEETPNGPKENWYLDETGWEYDRAMDTIFLTGQYITLRYSRTTNPIPPPS